MINDKKEIIFKVRSPNLCLSSAIINWVLGLPYFIYFVLIGKI